MQAIVVTLTIRDNLLATGLKHIFKTLFDIDARIFNTTQELKQTDINPDLTITDHSNFVADYGFFIQKRNRFVVISDNEQTDNNNFFVLNRYASEKEIIEKLSQIIKETHNATELAEELSQREKEVLCLIAKGFINKEIADTLNISINTVLSHRKNITAKLGIKSVSGLSVYAMMNGYI